MLSFMSSSNSMLNYKVDHEKSFITSRPGQVIVIPWVVRLYVEIIHELQRVDYLTYRWTNMVKPFYTTYISVCLAHHEIFPAKVGKGGIKCKI